MVGTFRTPTLRHLEHTGPYMHDGSMGSLEEVVRHYNRLGALCSIIMVRHCSSRSVSTRPPKWTLWPSAAHFLAKLTDNPPNPAGKATDESILRMYQL